MLVLTRMPTERIVLIKDGVQLGEITVIDNLGRRNQVRLGFTFSDDVLIVRQELLKQGADYGTARGCEEVEATDDPSVGGSGG